MAIERLLIGAGVTEDLSRLPDGIHVLIESANRILVMSPALPSRLEWLASDTDATRQKANERLQTVLSQLRDEDTALDGTVGADDPMLAFDEAVADFSPDHILIVMRPGEKSGWQENGLVEDVLDRFGVPVTGFRVPAE